MSDHKSWEAQAVDEIVAVELRIAEIYDELQETANRAEIAAALGLRTLVYEQREEELESELSDLQKVVGNE